MLEEAAGLLEATRLRLAALLPALESWRWKARVRAQRELAREVVRTEAAARDALARAQRRAAAEGWARGEVLKLLDDTERLFARLDGALTDRGFERLDALVRALIGVPRAVPLTGRDEAAAEALDPNDDDLRRLAHFGHALERVFSRPIERSKRLPFNGDEFDTLLRAWDAGVAALDVAWARVEAIDTTGGVERTLRRRALHAPRKQPADGPGVLVTAEFWLSKAESTFAQLAEERFAPVRPHADEQVRCARFLLEREGDGGARLAVAGARGALLMLAHELTGEPEGRAPLAGGATQVRAWAAEADTLDGSEDWRRLRDGLRRLTVRDLDPALPPLYRVGVQRRTRAAPERLADFFAAGALK